MMMMKKKRPRGGMGTKGGKINLYHSWFYVRKKPGKKEKRIKAHP